MVSLVNAAIALVVAWRTLPDFTRAAYRPGGFGIRTPFISGIAVVVMSTLVFVLPGLSNKLILGLEVILALTAVTSLAEALSVREPTRGLQRYT